LLPLGQKITTQENCKQDRNSLVKSVQKEKKVFKKTFGQSQIFFDQFYDASFFVCFLKNDKGKLQIMGRPLDSYGSNLV